MAELKQAAGAVANLVTTIGLSAEAGDKLRESGKFGSAVADMVAFTNQDQLSKAYDIKAKSDSKAGIAVLAQRSMLDNLNKLNLSPQDMFSVLNHLTILTDLLKQRPELLKDFMETCKIQQSFKNGDMGFMGDKAGSLAAFTLKAFSAAIGTALASSISAGVAAGIAVGLFVAEKGVDLLAEKQLKGIETASQEIDKMVNKSVRDTLGAMRDDKQFKPFAEYIDAAIKDIASGSDAERARDALNNVKMLQHYQSSDIPTSELLGHMKKNVQLIDEAIQRATVNHKEVTAKLSTRSLMEGHDPAKLAIEQRRLENHMAELTERKKIIEKIMPRFAGNLDITPRQGSPSITPAQREQKQREPVIFHADLSPPAAPSRSRSQSAATATEDVTHPVSPRAAANTLVIHADTSRSTSYAKLAATMGGARPRSISTEVSKNSVSAVSPGGTKLTVHLDPLSTLAVSGRSRSSSAATYTRVDPASPDSASPRVAHFSFKEAGTLTPPAASLARSTSQPIALSSMRLRFLPGSSSVPKRVESPPSSSSRTPGIPGLGRVAE